MRFKDHRSDVVCVAFSPDGKVLTSGASDETVRLWDTGTAEEKAVLRGHAKEVTSVAFSRDGQILVSASRDNKVKVWDPRTGREGYELEGYPWPIVFAHDRKTLAYSTYYPLPIGIVLYDVKEKKNRRAFPTPGSVRCLAFSPDGATLATGSLNDKQVRVWQASTGKELATLSGSGHRDTVLSVAFSPDGKLLVSAGRDGMVRLWDVAKVLEKKGE